MTSSRDPGPQQGALGTLAQHIRPRASWTDVALGDVQRDALQTFCQEARTRAVANGTAGDAAYDRGVAVLFDGATPSARTLAAEAVARDLDLPLYRVDLSAVVSKYIGETEKNLRRLFDAAERNATVLLFDEADALFGKRTETRDAHDRLANLDVTGLLRQLEAHAGLTILSTNLGSPVDPEVLRRFRLRIVFPRRPSPPLTRPS